MRNYIIIRHILLLLQAVCADHLIKNHTPSMSCFTLRKGICTSFKRKVQRESIYIYHTQKEQM